MIPAGVYGKKIQFRQNHAKIAKIHETLK